MLYRFVSAALTITIFLAACGGDDNGTDPDTTPPKILSTNPADNAENVPLNQGILVTFSENMKASTINESTFVISGNIPGKIGKGGKTATFTPDNDLDINKTYVMAITTGVQDEAGNALEENYVWRFTTAQVVLTDGENYLPIGEGDKWFYRDKNLLPVTREISGDTLINAALCKRILHNGQTAEAWSVDSSGFRIHLLTDDFHYQFDPALTIPFEMVYDAPYPYTSTATWWENDTLWSVEISGTLKFRGFKTYETPTGIQFDDVIQLYYIPDGYSEYYARGVGLLDNEDFVLDSAYVGGVWYR